MRHAVTRLVRASVSIIRQFVLFEQSPPLRRRDVGSSQMQASSEHYKEDEGLGLCCTSTTLSRARASLLIAIANIQDV